MLPSLILFLLLIITHGHLTLHLKKSNWLAFDMYRAGLHLETSTSDSKWYTSMLFARLTTLDAIWCFLYDCDE